MRGESCRPSPNSPSGELRVTTVHRDSLNRSLARLFVLALLAMTTQSAIAGPASSPAPSRYEISAGTLDEALQAFANQSDIQLLYSPMLVRGKYSDGLRGNHTPAAGLARLLTEHGLTAVAVNANTYLLRSAGNQVREASAPAKNSDTSLEVGTTELATVDVTGTRIPQTSLELSVPMTVITADNIERSGRRTLYDLLSERPGLVSHHPMTVSGDGRYYPTVVASGASLYSLGPRATLYLLNGKRIASFGLASNDLGGLIDLNSIPLSFIDRIEILRGGASAIYGADAMAGTLNIILKKGHEGGEISSRLGLSQQGDALSRQTSVMFGTRTRSGGNLLLAVNTSSQDELGGNRREWHTNDRSRFGLPDERVLIGFSSQFGVLWARFRDAWRQGKIQIPPTVAWIPRNIGPCSPARATNPHISAGIRILAVHFRCMFPACALRANRHFSTRPSSASSGLHRPTRTMPRLPAPTRMLITLSMNSGFLETIPPAPRMTCRLAWRVWLADGTGTSRCPAARAGFAAPSTTSCCERRWPRISIVSASMGRTIRRS